MFARDPLSYRLRRCLRRYCDVLIWLAASICLRAAVMMEKEKSPAPEGTEEIPIEDSMKLFDALVEEPRRLQDRRALLLKIRLRLFQRGRSEARPARARVVSLSLTITLTITITLTLTITL